MAVSTDSLDDRRFALLLAVSQYADPMLSRLRSPAVDAVALRDLLADPEVGGFAVTSVFDEKAQAMRLAVEEFLTDRRPDDLVLVYLSCHGLVDARRRLYFAARDTLKSRLASSGVEAHWLLEQLEDCRARRQVVVLDCCFSGAFARGAKGDTDVALGERLLGEGRGRVVLTASRGTEYSFEGDPTEGRTSGSVFTTALVSGITSGEADADDDGHISVDEAYAYAFDKVREAGGQQTPQRWLYGAEGSIVLARSPVTIGSTTHTGPAPRPEPPEAHVRPAPAPAPAPTGHEPRPLPHRVRLWLLGAAVAALLMLAGALVARQLDGGDGGGSREDGATSGSNQLTVQAPWRLVVRGDDVAGEGCAVTVTDEGGQSQTVEGVYATEYFQMHSSGTVEWEANHPDCEVFQQPTANEQQLPFVWGVSQGDSPAFSASDAVTVDVLDFHGTDGCELELHAVEDGRVISLGTGSTKAEPVVLDAYGASPLYIADSTCSFRITDGR